MSCEAPAASKVASDFAAAQARSYEEHVVKPLASTNFAVLKRLSPPGPGEACLDVATGTGPVAFRVAQLVGERGSVLGVDYSQDMLDLAVANGKSPEYESVSGRITWLQADACAMTLASASFDRAYCREGLQHMPDPSAACERIRAALKAGGTLIASCKAPADMTSNPMFAAFRAGMVSVGRAEWADMLRKPTGWAETDAEGVAKLESCLVKAGFADVSVVAEDVPTSFPGIEQVYAVLKALPFGEDLAGDAALFDALKSHVRRALAPHTDGTTGSVTLPLRHFFGRGTAP